MKRIIKNEYYRRKGNVGGTVSSKKNVYKKDEVVLTAKGGYEERNLQGKEE